MAKIWNYKTPGIPDELYMQSDEVPGPTKEEIRIVTISKARLNEGAIVIDVGCGTGGLTVEAALQVGPKGKVFAIDEDEAAIKLTNSNIEKFGVRSNVSTISGKAPQSLIGLPNADAILIGGGGFSLRAILQIANSKLKPNGRIIVNAILLETATIAIEELRSLGFKDVDVAEIFVAKGKQINSGTMMMARNPITIISATKLLGEKQLAGKFIGIGVGPGDPELITIKAAKTLKAVDVICVPKSHQRKPSMALGMVKSILAERKKPAEILELVFPMTKDDLNNRKLWVENAAIVASKAKKGDVAFITLGDPMLYSTFLYLYECVKETYPEVELEIIPGVTSVTAAAASAKLPLAEKEEVVSIMPSDLDSAHISDTAKHADNLVFMKCAYHIKEFLPILLKSGFTKNSTIALVKRCSLPEEKVLVGKLGDVNNWDISEDYFSVAIVKKSQVPIHWKQNGNGGKHE